MQYEFPEIRHLDDSSSQRCSHGNCKKEHGYEDFRKEDGLSALYSR